MTAEARLLCACVRRRAQQGADPVRVEVGADIDWHALIALAERHGVSELLPAPLLATRAVLPVEIADRLAVHQLGATARGLERAAQLIGLMTLLDRHGVRAAAFKGPTLAAMLYGDVGRRDSSDLDIVVEQSSIDRVRALMIDDGYAMPPARRRRNRSLFRGVYPAAGRDETLLPTRVAHVAVEVHASFAWWEVGLRLKAAPLLDRAVLVAIPQPVRALCAEDLLLTLSIHGMTHAWGLLRFVADIDAAAEAVTDWTAVIDRARAARMRRPLRVALLIAHQLLRTELPAAIAAWTTEDARAREMATMAAARLFDEPWVRPVDLGRSDHRFLPYLESPAHRLRFYLRKTAYEWVFKWPWDRWLSRRYQTRDGSR